jgi:hypothetical protein
MLQYWPESVNDLVKDLKHRRGMPIDIDTGKFRNILLTYDSDAFNGYSTYYPINTMNNTPQKFGNTYFSIDGIILNMGADQVFKGNIPLKTYQYDAPPEKSIVQKLFGVNLPKTTYSVEDTLNKLTHDKVMVRVMMSEPAFPYSLLGRLTVKSKDTDNNILVCTKPVLIKHGISFKDDELAYEWELAHVHEDKSKRYLGIFPL